MTEDEFAAYVRNDLLELVTSLALWRQARCGGTFAHSREVAADYLIDRFGVEGDGSVTEKMLAELAEWKEKSA
jgi:hypothetical protein